MTRFIRTLGGICAGAVLAVAAHAQDTPGADTVLATVNGEEITLGHVVAVRGQLPQQYQELPDEVLYDGILQQLIQQTVLMQNMESEMDRRTEVSLENERRAFLANEMLTQLGAREVTEDDIAAAYEERFAGAAPETEYNASHILVETEAEAQEIIGLLESGADFAELARARSTGPSGPNGGNLGWFGEGMMVKPFEDAVLALETGQVSPPVQTQFGWHVVILNETRTKDAPPLEQVRGQIAEEIQSRRVDAAVAEMTEAAGVEIVAQDIDPAVIRDVSVFDQ